MFKEGHHAEFLKRFLPWYFRIGCLRTQLPACNAFSTMRLVTWISQLHVFPCSLYQAIIMYPLPGPALHLHSVAFLD